MKTYKVKNLDIELTEEQLDDLIKQRENKGERFFFPEDNEIYCHLTSTGIDSDCDMIHQIERGVFRTEAQAKKEDKKRLALVRMWKFVQENGLYFDPDWSDKTQYKYHLAYSYKTKVWLVGIAYFCKYNFLFPHFKTSEDCQKFIDNNLSDLNLFV